MLGFWLQPRHKGAIFLNTGSVSFISNTLNLQIFNQKPITSQKQKTN